MKIFFAAEQLLHDPKHEFAAGGFRLAMEVPERATSVLAATEATAVGRVAAPPDYGLEPVARVHDPNLLAFLSTSRNSSGVRMTNRHRSDCSTRNQAYDHIEGWYRLCIGATDGEVTRSIDEGR